MKGTASNSNSRFSNRELAALHVVLFVVLFAASTVAQTATATLSGSVVDERDAAIPGANITIVNTGTGARRNTTANKDGYFTLPLLPPSQYTLTVEREGFTTVQVPDIALNVGDQKALQIMLKVGQVDAAIEVRPDETLVNTSPAVATTVDRTFVGNLPLNGRSFQSLILLTPGVVVTAAGAQPNSGQFSVNGQRGNANYFTLDGVSSNIGVSTDNFSIGPQQAAGSVPGLTALGTTNNLVSIDALEEFKILTSTYSAEFGRQPGGQVQLVTRSGENQFHGTAFDYIRNDIFDARDWFNKKPAPKPPLRQNQFGGTFSGPVFLPNFGDGGPGWYNGKNRTFFFFSYEGQRLVFPITFNSRVPSLRLRQIAAPGFRPLLNMYPVPTGPEDTNAAGVPTGMAPFLASSSSPSRTDSTSVRIDHSIGSNLKLFGRYNDAPSRNVMRTLNFLVSNAFKTQTLTLGTTWSPRPRLMNELRVNYSSNRGMFSYSMDSFGGAIPIDPSVLLSGYSGPGPKYGTFFLNLPGNSLLPSLGDAVDNYQRQINLVDNVSWVNGEHQFKFGIDYRRLAPVYGATAFRQTIDANSEAQVVGGLTRNVIITASQGVRPIFNNYSFYGQDNWKPSPRFTLDLGLRKELNPAPYDDNGLKPVLVCGIENLATATLCPPDTPLYKTSYAAFAPRFGVAYLLNKKSGRETVLRGGFGVYYDLGSGQATNGFSQFPFVASRILPNAPFPLTPSQAAPPAFPPVTLPISASVSALNQDLKLPYTMQWNVALEQSLGQQQTVTLSYVAAAGRRLLTTQMINLGPPLFAVRPNPNFGTIFHTYNGPTSDYHSFQARYQRLLSHGLQALVNYTWSHAIDEVSNEGAIGVLSRGNADFDVRHNLTAAITYNVPKPNAGIILTSLLRDWSLNSTLYIQSGSPMPVTAGTIAGPDGMVTTLRPDLVRGVPLWVRDSNAPGGRKLNFAAFQKPPDNPVFPGIRARQGTLGRNVVTVSGIFQVNMAIARKFSLTENWNLELRAEAFNLFNHPQFSRYNSDILAGPSAFGLASSTLNKTLGGQNFLYQIGGSRSMQFSIRLSF